MKLGRLLVRTGFVASGFVASLVLIGASMPGRARAFSEPRTYAADPRGGGGGNRWFTGSPAEGYGCSDCHTGGQPPRLYIDGLPATGYVPGGVYDVRLAWPEFAARFGQFRDQVKAQQALPPVPGVIIPNPPSMGVLAELVADSGLGAGTIEIATTSDATEPERCAGGRFGTELYSVRPGLKTVKVVRACGPQELHFRWTAPAVPQGAIWFAAGFVGTDAFSGNPQGDGVTETTRVMLPAGSGGDYESVLRSNGCSVSAASAGGSVTGRARGLLGALFIALGCALRVRRAQRGVRVGRS